MVPEPVLTPGSADSDSRQSANPVQDLAQAPGTSSSDEPPVSPENPSAETRQPSAGGVPIRHSVAQRIVMIALSDMFLNDPTRLSRDEVHIQEIEADYARRQKDHPEENPIQTPLRVVEHGDKYTIVAGGNRFLAALRRGLQYAPCIVLRHGLDAADMLIEQVRDNSLHQAYTPMEDARNMVALMQLRPGLCQYEAARELNIDETKANKVLKILNFYPADLHCLIGEGDGKVPFTTAYVFAQLMERTGDETKVRELTEKTVKGLLTRDPAVKLVRGLLNKREKAGKSKTVKITVGGVTMVFKEKIIETWRAARAIVDEAVKKLEKDSLPDEVLAALVKS